APSKAPRPNAWTASAKVSSPSGSASQAASQVRYRFVPVSPSGTGYTLSSLISSRASASADSAASAHRRSTSVVLTRSVVTRVGYPEGLRPGGLASGVEDGIVLSGCLGMTG